MPSERQYDIIVLGATGYTGRLAVQHIYRHLPTNLRWAVAGRSPNKLVGLITPLQEEHPDRRHPGVQPADLNEEDLSILVQKTKVLINCVGPYHKYSTPVIEACAAYGTHYADLTGETTWLASLLPKIHEKAKASGAILVPEVALESLPTDLLAYEIAAYFRKKYNADTEHVTTCVYRLKTGGFSGGTLSTALSLFDSFPLPTLMKVNRNPYVLAISSPRSLPKSRRPTLSRLFGPFSLPPFGIMTTSPGASPNIAIAHRSASLLPSVYGPSFRLEEYLRVSFRLIGAAVHLAISIVPIFLIFSPFRRLLQRLLTQPGSGPTDASNQDSELEFRGLGVAIEPQTGKERNAVSRLVYHEHAYHMSAVGVVETGMAILEGEGKVKERFGGGGMLTAACLAETTGLVDRLRGAGFEIEVEELET